MLKKGREDHAADGHTVTADSASVLLAAAERNAQGARCVLATVVSTKGSTPRKAGAKMLVGDDGSLVGSIGGGRIEHEIVEAARGLLQGPNATDVPRVVRFHLTHDLAMCCGGEMDVFLEPLGRLWRVVLVGAGHIHQALAPILRAVSFEVTVVDDLEELASAARFPDARQVLSWDPRDWRIPLEKETFVVVASRDHAVDQDVIEALARLGQEAGSSLGYLGVVGSEGKLGRFKKRFVAKELPPAFIDALRGPVGLAVGAETPAEIAVSIAAELIAVRRGVR